MPDSDEQLAILRLAWRVDSLDRWRDKIDKRVDDCERGIEGLTKAQEIAEGVAEKLRETGVTVQAGGLGLTWWQKLGGALMGAVVVIDAIRGLIS